MKSIDMRLDEKIIQKWIGKRFIKYKCDYLTCRNSVTAIVGLYFDKEIFSLNNLQTTVDYFGTKDDCGVLTLEYAASDNIKSFFDNVEQVETYIGEIIKKITIINENQRIYQKEKQTYDVWFTRGVIIHFADWELSFEKDNIPFSQEIIIRKGYKLEKYFSDEKEFLEGWANEITPQCSRESVIIEGGANV